MNNNDHKAAFNRALARIIGKNIRSSSSKALVSEIAKEAINNWTKDSTFKKKLAAPALWAAKRIGRPGKDEQDKAMAMAADMGTLLTTLARKVNAGQASKICNDKTRGEAIDAFLQNTDFGEVLEMIEGADPHVIESIRALNEQLWKYPAKVGTLTLMAIALTNTSIKGAREIMRPIEEQFSPDLLADLILSMIRDLNGANAATLTNTVFELIRRVHTGSLLIGKGGKPLFQKYLTGFLKDYFSAMDPELLKKVRICLAEDKESIANAKSEALDANPRIVLSVLSSLGKVKNSEVRGKARKLKVLEDIDRAGFNAAVSESVSDLDTYEVAGLINTACRVLNQIHDAKPDIVGNLVGGIVDSMDSEQIRRTFQWLIPDLVEALRPLAPIIVPEIIKGFNELAIQEDGAGISLTFAQGAEK
ncbi:MAG: hypothetical protein CVU51_08715 [Deltaproteobacteria bacterium HGW-Deltaproteobacteria-1]|jgi:hypothetical protein|nr:MAG: hypothetical protein CVU51_08715 [Deltaproteobacteria bacterium HGW-Deltaproteobacteria-1]